MGMYASELIHCCRQKMMLLANVPLFQCILNLTGRSDDILDMSHGEAVHYRALIGWEHRTGEHAEWSYQMQIAFYCEDFGLATSLSKKLQHIDVGPVRGLPIFHARVFFFALIAMHNAKATGKRKYIFEARKHYKVVKHWVSENRAINVVHKLLILDAEMLTMSRRWRQRKNELVEAFDRAVAASTRAGFLQDAALAAHLASRAIDGDECLDYFRRARELYLTWGAKQVVDHIGSTSSFRPMIPRPALTSTSPGYRSREHFDGSVALSHKKLQIDPL